MLAEILIASFVVMLAALGGALSFWQAVGKIIEKNLGLLISFTAGLFLFVSYELGREAILHSPNIESGLFWIFAGAIGIWIIFKLLPHSHKHDNIEEKNTIDIRKLLTGNGIHNIGDGILLAAAFSIDVYLGIIATISVFVHELVQETSIFFVLRKAGYTIKQSILINFAVSGTILIGSVGAFFLLSFFSMLEAVLLGISAGAFLVVVLQDLIPHSFHELRCKKCFFPHVLAFTVGLFLMFALSLLMPHSHEHHHHDYDHHNHYDHEHNDYDHDHNHEHEHTENHH